MTSHSTSLSKASCLRAFYRLLLLLFGILFFVSQPTQAQSRKALIIGNSQYGFAPLRNPVNDAQDMAATLEEAGFSVNLITDAGQTAIIAAINNFSAGLGKEDIALFFFAGHGVQIDDRNYLIPVDANLSTQADAKEQAVDMSVAMDAVVNSGAMASIFILDACRDNPLPAATRSLTRGLARQNSTASGMFMSFSTSPGAVALDGEGRNSPYTKNLIKAIKTPNISLEETFKRTLKAVHQETNGVQTPWVSSSFFGDFSFIGQPQSQSPVQSPTQNTAVQPPKPVKQAAPSEPINPPASPLIVEGTYDNFGTNPDGSKYRGEAYLSRIGDSWRFEWLIGGQTFVGIGEFKGDKLSIEWGDSNPVIYSIPKPGLLDGRWGPRGKATDVLALRSVDSAKPKPTTGISGLYKVSGRNPDGSAYSGRVQITKRGDRYGFQWNVGGQSYSGIGVLKKGVMIVDWGSTHPVVYKVLADGRLSGTWANGKAAENLSR